MTQRGVDDVTITYSATDPLGGQDGDDNGNDTTADVAGVGDQLVFNNTLDLGSNKLTKIGAGDMPFVMTWSKAAAPWKSYKAPFQATEQWGVTLVMSEAPFRQATVWAFWRSMGIMRRGPLWYRDRPA